MYKTGLAVDMNVLTGQELAMTEDLLTNLDGEEHEGRGFDHRAENSADGDSRQRAAPLNRMGSTRLSIIAGIQRGDPEAQSRFSQQYRPPILAYFLANGRFDFHTAEDLAQRVMLKICDKQLHTYQTRQGRRAFRNYLFPILEHEAETYRRERKKDPAKPNMDAQAALAAADAEETSPITVMSVSELAFIESRRRQVLDLAFDIVRARERKGNPQKGKSLPFDVNIFVWYEFDHLPYKTIAERTRLTYHAVKSRARAGRLRLNEAIRQVIGSQGKNKQQIDDEIIELCDPLEPHRRASDTDHGNTGSPE